MQQSSIEKRRARVRLYYQQHRQEILLRQSKYRDANRERINQLDRDRYAKDPDHRLALIKERRQSNPEPIRKREREYYQKRREKLQTKSKLYRRENKETLRDQRRVYSQTPKGRWKRVRESAKVRHLEVSITFDDFLAYWDQLCFYCGQERPTHGIDRIDNNLGYLIDNIVPCCEICNKMKNRFTQSDFLQRCCLIADQYRGGKK